MTDSLKYKRTAAYVLVAVALCFLTLVSVTGSLTKPLGHDENMYCTGGVLLSEGKLIYRDFSYVGQLPWHPLICASLFRLFHTNYYLLTVRLFSTACDIATGIFIVLIYLRLFNYSTAGAFFAVVAVIFYLFNPLTDYANGFAWNHDPAIFCVMLSCLFFIFGKLDARDNYFRLFLTGGLLTLATFMRLTFGFALLLFFAAILFSHAASFRERLKRAAGFLSGFIVVSAWPVWVIAQSGSAFLLNVFTIPVLNSQWQHETNFFIPKLTILLNTLSVPSYILLLVLAPVLYMIIFLYRQRLNPMYISIILMPLLLSLIFFGVAFGLPTTLYQYLAAPIPFLIVSVAYPLSRLAALTEETGGRRVFQLLRAVFIAFTIVSIIKYPLPITRIPQLFKPESNTALTIHKLSTDIARKVKSSSPVFTLSPLYAIEGGLKIYRELSAGPFVYRIASRLSPSDLTIVHGVGRDTLKNMLNESPPSAIILGGDLKVIERHIFEEIILPTQQEWLTETYQEGIYVFYRR